ncbi:MAG: PEP-utilizing enzyme [Chloroflexota bacterium]|nr:PEP-utilizing enzyme [Chloroflexota bacterium]
MFDFVIEGGPPEDDVTVWSKLPLQALAPGVLTPFSYSVLSEIVDRAWHQYYDRLGFKSAPGTRTVRQWQGRAYVNLSAAVRLEASCAGVTPMALRLNGELHPLATLEKPSLLGGLKNGRNQKKIDALLDATDQGIGETAREAYYWMVKTQEMRWTQADTLQVMEEIERVGVDSMLAYYAARHNLELLYNRLIRATLETVGYPAALPLINGALCDLDDLVETEIAAALMSLCERSSADDAVAAWLKQDSFDNWRARAPNSTLAEGLTEFIGTYGHRVVGEAEIARPRWYEDPTPVMHGLLGCLLRQAKPPIRTPSSQSRQRLLDALDAAQVKGSEAVIQQLRRLHHLQSHALHALAYIWAGTREWAKAAAHEAAHDGRLQEEDEVFFFQLEEIKQMMTGEWNVSDLSDIHATAAERKRQVEAWRELHTPPVLVGDRAARFTGEGLPGVSGLATGPLRRLPEQRTEGCKGAILGVEYLDSGWALALPAAKGFVAAGGTPADPFVAAARAWHRPTVIGLGEAYYGLVEGAQTTVDGDAATVEQ